MSPNQFLLLMYRVRAVKLTVSLLPVKHLVTTVSALLVEGAYYVGASNQHTWDFMLMGNGAGKYIGECKDITGFLHNTFSSRSGSAVLACAATDRLRLHAPRGCAGPPSLRVLSARRRGYLVQYRVAVLALNGSLAL